jgi:MFS family permease
MNLLWLGAACSVLVLVLAGAASYPAAQPLLAAELGINASESGFIFAAYRVGYVVGTLIILPLTDRFDARRILIASATLATLANVLFPILADSVPIAALLRAAAGLGLVGVYMPGVRVVADQFPRRRGAAVGAYVAAFYLGVNLALVIAGWLLPVFGWRTALLVIAVAAAPGPLLALIAFRRVRVTVPARNAGQFAPALLTNSAVLLVILAYAAHSWELYVAWAWLAPYMSWILTERGQATAEAAGRAATAVGLAGLPSALCVVLGGALSDRVGRIGSAGAILLASALGSLLLGWLDALPWPVLVAFVVIYSSMLAADSAIYSAAVTELARPGEVGATQALQSFMGFTATALSPIVAGLALDAAGSPLGWRLAFGQAGVVALGGVVCLALSAATPGPQRPRRTVSEEG